MGGLKPLASQMVQAAYITSINMSHDFIVHPVCRHFYCRLCYFFKRLFLAAGFALLFLPFCFSGHPLPPSCGVGVMGITSADFVSINPMPISSGKSCGLTTPLPNTC